MGGLSLSFGAPLVLAGLLALPLIWWLLRLTPPRPQTETFPPLRILERVAKREETPSNSPWWLTLLRLLLAAAIILALAAPILNPRESALSGNGPVVVFLDNGWASARDWTARRGAAEALIREAGESGRPVSLVLTATPRRWKRRRRWNVWRPPSRSRSRSIARPLPRACPAFWPVNPASAWRF